MAAFPQPNGDVAGRRAGTAEAGGLHQYHVYGLRLLSPGPLPYPDIGPDGLAEVLLEEGTTALFSRALQGVSVPEGNSAWVTAPTRDGSTYLRWSGLFDFLIAPHGHAVTFRSLSEHAQDAFHTHLGASLSFALINLGIEPLHSTTVVIDGAGVAIMGDCGYGKSSLGTEFVRAGHQLLTDDLLVVRSEGTQVFAYPGAPRVKLFPEIATQLLGPDVRGLELKRLTPKLIIPLDQAQACARIVPLKAIYVLTRPSARARAGQVRIRQLSQRQAFLELVRNTFNMAITDAGRLQRQFAQAAHLGSAIPVKSISYPRISSMLPAARRAILGDLAR